MAQIYCQVQFNYAFTVFTKGMGNLYSVRYGWTSPDPWPLA